MTHVLNISSGRTLEERLAKGADMLFEMEQRGEVSSPQYHRWLTGWTELLEQYETEHEMVREAA